MRRKDKSEPVKREEFEWYVFEVFADGEVILSTKALMYPSQARRWSEKAKGNLSLTIARKVESLEPL